MIVMKIQYQSIDLNSSDEDEQPCSSDTSDLDERSDPPKAKRPALECVEVASLLGLDLSMQSVGTTC